MSGENFRRAKSGIGDDMVLLIDRVPSMSAIPRLIEAGVIPWATLWACCFSRLPLVSAIARAIDPVSRSA